MVTTAVSFTYDDLNDAESLRRQYSRPPSQWPASSIPEGMPYEELGILLPVPVQGDSAKHLIELGKILFFDTRMSGSGKISCATCHQPPLSWTDGREKSFGHDGAVNKRNAPTLQNVWFYKKLFWDGRSHSLEDQAFAPINSESEMHSDMRSLPFQLKKIKGYAPLFDSAFGDPRINPDRIASALAAFQRTISSRQSRFDEFLSGKKYALDASELRGLHLFRTKARCMHCHQGPMFTDNDFHNNGFALDDPGLYNVTHNHHDVGKFKTPSLRDVAMTGPWMHNGASKFLPDIIAVYNRGEGKDKLIKKLFLTNKEQADLVSFLKAISAPPIEFKIPPMPE